METIFSLLAILGMGFACFKGFKWMLKSGQVNARKSEQLTPSDLRVLEESAERLISDIRSAADDAVARIERCMLDAEHRLAFSSGAQIPSSIMNAYSEPVEQPVFVATPNFTREHSEEYSTKSTAPLTGELILLENLRKIAEQ